MLVMLVTMPWAALDTPSLALGILHRIVESRGVEVETLCANLDFYDWAAASAQVTVDDYDFFATRSYADGYGDWVFSSALYEDRRWRLREFVEHMADGLDARERELAILLHRTAPDFVDELAARIVAAAPDVVGFTTTFQQNIASLAVAKKIKMWAPRLTTVFGGANCDGVQGAALHRNFPQLDYVVRGDGEQALPALLDVLSGTRDPRTVAGLCWRTGDRRHQANDMSPTPSAARHLVRPNLDAYFARVERSSARPYLEPKLILESARGCWWGERHHCTFCGLNGSAMTFRSKNPDDVLDEIVHQTRRHRILDVVVVDNILDPAYLRTLLPGLAETGHDYRLHYEIKSNLQYRQLAVLADAGLVQVQPGIESLSTRVLRLMNKGVTGCQNVRHLRDAQSAGIWAAWNLLYGFPGETEEDYTSIVEQVPALHHLTPPDAVTRIALERFSPYFDQPELGFPRRWPAPHYAWTYDLPEAELSELAYLFAAPDAGIGPAAAGRLAECVERWRAAHGSSRLTHCDLGHKIVLVSRRRDFDWTTHTIHDPVEVAAFRMLADPRSLASLTRRLSALRGSTVPEERIRRLLRSWREAGIVYEDADRFVHVAPVATNAELTRLSASPVEITRRPGRRTADAASTLPPGRGVMVSLWRDYQDEALRLPGMHLGTRVVTEGADEAARAAYRAGARRAEITGILDLTADADPASALLTLDLVRELTAWGIVVDWRVRLAEAESWILLSHLYPPVGVDAPDGARQAHRRWTDGFFLGRCHHRAGPGFLEVRDHRRGVLNRVVIHDPDYLDAVRALIARPATATVPAPILHDFAAESLVLPVGGRHWWAPYRPHRWAQPPFSV